MDTRTLSTRVAAALSEDAKAHRAGDFGEVGAKVDELDALRIPFLDPVRLGLAFAFWDCWIDARNHDWRYHEPVKCQDWPELADHVIQALENELEITDPLVLGLI